MKRAQLKIKVPVSSIWAKGCMLDDCVCSVEGESPGILLL